MKGTARPVEDDLVNYALAGLGFLFGLMALLRVAGTIAAYVSGAGGPRAGLIAGLTALTHPNEPAHALQAPGLSPVAYWLTVALMVAAISAVTLVAISWVRTTRHRSSRDPNRVDGTATRMDVAATASSKALLRRGKHLRPSLPQPDAAEIGYYLGQARGHGIWASVEDSILVIGPPRSGKGLHLVINAILDAPGAVVTTSTRPDNLTATIAARTERGPVAVFDPQGLTHGLDGTAETRLRWSPIRGCEEPLTAMIRATGLAASTGLSAGGTDNGGFWEIKTRTVLQSLLHAAALGNCSTRTLFEWTLSPSAAADAVSILAGDVRAAAGWADALSGVINSDPRSREGVWLGVSSSMGCLADPAVLDAVSPRFGEEFNPTTFLTKNGTLYLLATGAGAGAAWPLVAAFVEDITETARHLAATAPGTRLDPPLLLALDEIGNLAPLPSLPVLMAEGGGTGITTMPVLQSLAQARNRWGDHAAATIWDASIVKVILGGASATRDLQELSTLIGERDETSTSTTIGDYGSRSVQSSVRRIPIMAPDRIRMLPFGTGMVLLRAAPPIVTTLRRYTERT